jgi:hypothetical protein
MEIAETMGKTYVSVKSKISNLGLSLKDTTPGKQTVVSSSSLDMSQGLPSVEEKLKDVLESPYVIVTMASSTKYSIVVSHLTAIPKAT